MSFIICEVSSRIVVLASLEKLTCLESLELTIYEFMSVSLRTR